MKQWKLSSIPLFKNEPAPMDRRFRIADYAHWVVIACAVTYFLLMAFRYLDRPGLYYDEVLFVHAALGGGDPYIGFVSAYFHGFPTMIVSYTGAFKSYLYAPIFDLFGVSVTTIRVPVIILSAMSVLLGYPLGRLFLGKWESTILVLLMSTTPAFILSSKVDWGPIVLPMLLKFMTLIVFFRLVYTGQIRYLWLLGGLVLLGIFNKQDFIWVVSGMCVAGVLVYARPLWEIARTRWIHVVVALATIGALGLELARKVIFPNLGAPGNSSLQNPFPHMQYIWNNYQGILGETDMLGFFAERGAQPEWMALASTFTIAALVFLLLTRLLSGKLPEPVAVTARATVFFSIVFAIMFVQIAATKLATGPHHVIELWPFQILIIMGSGSAMLQILWQRRAVFATWARGAWTLTRRDLVPGLATLSLVFAGLALITTIATQAVSTVGVDSLLQQPDNVRPVFRMDVYSIAGYINANESRIDEVVTANWGMGEQLYSLACPDWRAKVRDDIWWQLVGATPQVAAEIVRNNFGNQRVLVVDINHQSEYDWAPTFRVDASVFQQAYASVYPQRHSVLELKTSAYNVFYFGPQNDLRGKPSTDEGCSKPSGQAAASIAGLETALAPFPPLWRVVHTISSGKQRPSSV